MVDGHKTPSYLLTHWGLCDMSYRDCVAFIIEAHVASVIGDCGISLGDCVTSVIGGTVASVIRDLVASVIRDSVTSVTADSTASVIHLIGSLFPVPGLLLPVSFQKQLASKQVYGRGLHGSSACIVVLMWPSTVRPKG